MLPNASVELSTLTTFRQAGNGLTDESSEYCSHQSIHTFTVNIQNIGKSKKNKNSKGNLLTLYYYIILEEIIHVEEKENIFISNELCEEVVLEIAIIIYCCVCVCVSYHLDLLIEFQNLNKYLLVRRNPLQPIKKPRVYKPKNNCKDKIETFKNIRTKSKPTYSYRPYKD